MGLTDIRIIDGEPTSGWYFKDTPKEKWRKVASLKSIEAAKQLAINAKSAINMIDEICECDAYKEIGFNSFQEFLEKRIRITTEQFKLIKSGLGILGPGEFTAKQAETEGRKLAAHGGDRRSQEAKLVQGSNSTTLKERGKGYWLARLERDRPDVLAELRAGKYNSVHAATLAAGFIREPAKRSAVEKARRALAALSEDERAALFAEFGG